MGLGCGEIAGGGMSGGIWFVKVFNTGDDGGGGGVCSRHPQQVWTNRRSPGDGWWGRLFLTVLQYFWVFQFFKTHSSMSHNLKERVSWAIGGYSKVERVL